MVKPSLLPVGHVIILLYSFLHNRKEFSKVMDKTMYRSLMYSLNHYNYKDISARNYITDFFGNRKSITSFIIQLLYYKPSNNL
jgi:hypothetical protein